jgi:F-type H+-transporting ATPase subunit delta
MSVLVAKRYVKALLIDRSINDIVSIYDNIKTIASAYNYSKFLSIVSSVQIDIDTKLELINSFIDYKNKSLKNLFLVLAENKRLMIIPDIAKELKEQIAVLTNSYEGIVYTNVKLDEAEIISIQEKFTKKFDITLTLTQNICDYDGIKVNIEGLGVEIGFSKERLKSQMIDYILKAV